MPFGVCLEIEHVERMPGQGVRAHFVGKFRFWVVEPPQLHQDGFELGRCEAFFDEPLPLAALILSPAQDADTEVDATGTEGECAIAPTPEVARASLELLERQLVNIGHAGRHAFRARFGDTPQLHSATGATTSAAMEMMSFWLLGVLVSDD